MLLRSRSSNNKPDAHGSGLQIVNMFEQKKALGAPGQVGYVVKGHSLSLTRTEI